MITLPRLLFLFLSCFLHSVLANQKQECKACVADGCTYCRRDKFFKNPSVCACDLDSGFFGSCHDYSFGAKPLDSNLDCAFNTHLSWLVVIAILLGVGIFFCVIYCFCIRNRSSSSGGGIPEPTTSNTTTAAANTTSFHQNHFATATATATIYQPGPGTSSVPFATAVPYADETAPPAYNPSYGAPVELDINVGGKTSVVDAMMSDLNSSHP
jgi:hypothetical protein